MSRAPSTSEVRWAATTGPGACPPAQFDAWLYEHDREVLIDYEKKRKPDPVIIENIQGEPAREWLAKRDMDVAAASLRAFASADLADLIPHSEISNYWYHVGLRAAQQTAREYADNYDGGEDE